MLLNKSLFSSILIYEKFFNKKIFFLIKNIKFLILFLKNKRFKDNNLFLSIIYLVI